MQGMQILPTAATAVDYTSSSTCMPRPGKGHFESSRYTNRILRPRGFLRLSGVYLHHRRKESRGADEGGYEISPQWHLDALVDKIEVKWPMKFLVAQARLAADDHPP